jgi:hypothetical protein
VNWNFYERWQSSKKAQEQRAAFCDRLLNQAVRPEDVQAVHHVRFNLERDFETRLRSVQTLLETDYVPAFGLALKQLMETCRVADDSPEAFVQLDSVLNILSLHTPASRWR